MGAIKAAIGDAILTFMWVFLSSTMGAMLALIATALCLETLVWPSVLITTSIVFDFCSCFHLQLDWGCLGWRQLQSRRQCLLICRRPRPRHSLLHGPPLLCPKSLPLIKPNPKSSSIIEV